MNHTGTIMLTTKRLTLRRFNAEDAESMFYNWAGDKDVVLYLKQPIHKNPEDSLNAIKDLEEGYKNADCYNWGIEINETEQLIGSVRAVDIDDNIGAVQIGYCIGRDFWGKGYTSEALNEVVRFFFEDVRADRVWGEHDARNAASGKVMEKCGLVYEGTMKRAGLNNAGFADMAVYGRVRDFSADTDDTEEDENAMAAVVTKVTADDGTVRNVISDETMEYVGILAKLELNADEAKAAKKDMEEMLDYIDKLNELDTSGIEPMSHIFPIDNVFRDDIVANKDNSDMTLLNAPECKDGGFKVPKTIGE